MNTCKAIILILGVACLSACETTQTHENTHKDIKIERISDKELEQLLPKPVPNIALSELVDLSKSGVTADELIDRIKQSGTRYALTPGQAIELNKQGVDVKVLDYLYSAQQQALRDSFADDINRREVEHRKQLDQLMRELLRRPYYSDPFWPYHPYWHGGW
jgi:hypothetical protein